jgi:hypothetical protein
MLCNYKTKLLDLESDFSTYCSMLQATFQLYIDVIPENDPIAWLIIKTERELLLVTLGIAMHSPHDTGSIFTIIPTVIRI